MSKETILTFAIIEIVAFLFIMRRIIDRRPVDKAEEEGTDND